MNDAWVIGMNLRTRTQTRSTTVTALAICKPVRHEKIENDPTAPSGTSRFVQTQKGGLYATADSNEGNL